MKPVHECNKNNKVNQHWVILSWYFRDEISRSKLKQRQKQMLVIIILTFYKLFKWFLQKVLKYIFENILYCLSQVLKNQPNIDILFNAFKMSFNSLTLTPSHIKSLPPPNSYACLLTLVQAVPTTFIHTFPTCTDDTSYILDTLWCTLLHLHVHIAFSPWGLDMGFEQVPVLSNNLLVGWTFVSDYLCYK